MTKELKRVIWEWLPGVVAGLMPLLVFMLVKSQVLPIAAGKTADAALLAAAAEHRFYQGLGEHLIVFSIVTSTVSTFTSFPRLFANSQVDAPIGQASLGLVMLITLILAFSVAMYVLHEAGVTNTNTLWPSATLVLATLVTSLYMEFAIANIRLSRAAAKET